MLPFGNVMATASALESPVGRKQRKVRVETITNAMSWQRPERISDRVKWPMWRVVKSSKQLHPTDKLVYQEILHMDMTEDGCFLQTEHLAERCGFTVRQVEDSRRRLRGHGLLASTHRPGYKADAWFATFPITMPGEHPSTEEVSELTHALDVLLSSPTFERTPNPDTPTFERTSNAISSTLKRRPLNSTEPSTEKVQSLVSREKRFEGENFETWKKNWRDEMGREPTKSEIERYARTGTDE